MVVRLQTSEGEIKEYWTIQCIGGGEYGPDKYITKCGRQCIEWPKNLADFNYLNCDHLDCAIYLEELNAKRTDIILFTVISLIIFILVLNWLGFNSALILSGIVALFSLCIMITEIAARKKLEELTEYREKGTIKGIKAWRIYEDAKSG
ncbi:Uncharacterised protein [uncultured archaeon]|nr:Uncharacterised protein [uncultured archaeon]